MMPTMSNIRLLRTTLAKASNSTITVMAPMKAPVMTARKPVNTLPAMLITPPVTSITMPTPRLAP